MKARTVYFSFAMCVALPIAAWAQDYTSASAEAHMAPMAQYLMPRDSEIALARSAAPPSVSHDAKILVLGEHGYETAVTGSNGFVCLVARSWDLNVDQPGSHFWDPRTRVAKCYNAQGAEMRLPQYMMKTEWAQGGASEAEIATREKAAWAAGKLKEVALPGAMAYMMSNQSWGVGATPGPWRPHLMFYYPTGQAPSWGANLDGTPIASAQTSGSEKNTVYFVLVPEWSDGSLAPALKAPAAQSGSSSSGHHH